MRLGRVIAFSAPLERARGDGGFHMSGDDRQDDPYYNPPTHVSGALFHELSH